MARHINRITAVFDPLTRLAVLNIPIASQTIALRFYEHNQYDPTDRIGVIILIDPAAPIQMYTRYFQLWPHGTDLPTDFKKYVATFPLDPTKMIVDVIERSPGASVAAVEEETEAETEGEESI